MLLTDTPARLSSVQPSPAQTGSPETPGPSHLAGSSGGQSALSGTWLHLAGLRGLGLAQALAGVALLAAAFPGSSLALETAPPGFIQMLLDVIEELGPLGPVAYTALVACCELIPLFPTQPLSLASGLLFGAQKGAFCMCLGTTLAAAIAFYISRGVGKPLAERIIQHEIDEAGISSGSKNSIESKLHHVQEAIEHGSWWKQAGAIFLLRMTPVVPFSASNYLLGLTPLPVAPYLAGTALGMACWSLVYASLGGASRSLLAKGVSADALLADLLERASQYTHEVAVAALLAGVAVAGAWGADAIRKGLLPASSQAGLVAPLVPERKEQLVEMED